MPAVNGLGKRLATLAVSAASLGLTAQTAAARITADGIGCVEVGMTEAEVRDEVGRPSSVRSEGRGSRRLDYRRRKLAVLLYKGSVVNIRTTSRAQRTASGIGAGVREATARRKLRDEQCTSALGLRVCTVEHEDTVLTISSRGGRVVLVTVGVAGL